MECFQITISAQSLENNLRLLNDLIEELPKDSPQGKQLREFRFALSKRKNSDSLDHSMAMGNEFFEEG